MYQIAPDDTAAAVKTALEIGYRHIDTAEMYGNEREVGQGIRDAGVDRADVFVTSKLNNGFHEPDDARRAFDQTLNALGSDYVDLFLIHWPLPTLYGGDFVSTWHTLEEFARTAGPAASGCPTSRRPTWSGLRANPIPCRRSNQIEVHPYFTNEEVRAYDRRTVSPPRRGLRSRRAWCSTTRWCGGLPTRQASRRPRWCCAGTFSAATSCFPKSVTPQRIRENFALFDFELSDSDSDALTSLDKGEAGRTGPNPDKFDYIPS